MCSSITLLCPSVALTLNIERIRLLVHILCELRESHAICVEKLKEADQSVRRQIAPVERIPVLDEIYHVREEEERYLDGRTGKRLPSTIGPFGHVSYLATADGSAVICVSRVHLPELTDSQTLGSPTQALKESNPVYRKEIPDLESHTSVFPSTATTSPLTSKPPTSKASDPCKPPIPTAWDTDASASFAPLKRHREGDYPLDLTGGAMFHQEPAAAAAAAATTTLDANPYSMKYYPHSQAQQSLPVMGLSGDLGSCTHPYYFNY